MTQVTLSLQDQREQAHSRRKEALLSQDQLSEWNNCQNTHLPDLHTM